MLYTSYFSNKSIPDNATKISIARFNKLDMWENKTFAPSKELLMKYKREDIYEKEFKKRFLQELNNIPEGLIDLYREVFIRDNSDQFFLCYEEPNDFCHRHIVAEFLRSKGIPIEEYTYKNRVGIWNMNNTETDSRGFRGEYIYLSNFYPADKEISIMHPFLHKEYKSKYVEVLYQICKTTNEVTINNMVTRLPKYSKKKSHEFEVVEGFEDIKFDIMRELVFKKFQVSPLLREKLKATTKPIVEWNSWNDTTWGADIESKIGENWLGLILMEFRDITEEV